MLLTRDVPLPLLLRLKRGKKEEQSKLEGKNVKTKIRRDKEGRIVVMKMEHSTSSVLRERRRGDVSRERRKESMREYNVEM